MAVLTSPLTKNLHLQKVYFIQVCDISCQRAQTSHTQVISPHIVTYSPIVTYSIVVVGSSNR